MEDIRGLVRVSASTLTPPMPRIGIGAWSAVDAFASMRDVVDVVVALDHRLGVPQNSKENQSLVSAAQLTAW